MCQYYDMSTVQYLLSKLSTDQNKMGLNGFKYNARFQNEHEQI